MKKKLLLITAAALSFSACQDEPSEQTQQDKPAEHPQQDSVLTDIYAYPIINVDYEEIADDIAIPEIAETLTDVVLPASCQISGPTCYNDTTIYSCESGYDPDDNVGKALLTHCIKGYKCQDGSCVKETKGCAASACLDYTSIGFCDNGVMKKAECPNGQVCFDDKCQDMPGVTACTTKEDCAADEICRDRLCYKESNFSITIGSKCNSLTFQEYCDGDKEIWCGYDGTVEVNDCAPYNGCSVYVKKAYKEQTTIRNAICRGNSEELAQCREPGILSYYCLNVEDEYMSFYYSLANACIMGTDGRLIYKNQRDETSCPDKCNENTGLCF